MVMDLFGNNGEGATAQTAVGNPDQGVICPFIGQLPVTAKEVMVVLLPIF